MASNCAVIASPAPPHPLNILTGRRGGRGPTALPSRRPKVATGRSIDAARRHARRRARRRARRVVPRAT